MCTISLVTSPDGSALRLLMNRDERRLRPVGQPPTVHQTPVGRAVWPTDPLSGGSWIAATDTGLALAVLNMDGHRRSPDRLSRGTLIPLFATCRSLEDVVERWERLDRSAYAPFRLLALTRDLVAVCTSGARIPTVTRVGRARVFASSSLGDAKVEPLRADLLARLLCSETDAWTAQTRFHQHTWPDRRHLSVMMSRVEASTVSQTEVLLTSHSVVVAYRPVVDGWLMPEARRVLPVSRATSRAA